MAVIAVPTVPDTVWVDGDSEGAPDVVVSTVDGDGEGAPDVVVSTVSSCGSSDGDGEGAPDVVVSTLVTLDWTLGVPSSSSATK